MDVIAQVFAGLAALVHVLFFYLESIAFRKPQIYRRFLVADEVAAGAVRPWALNQGFYNLFLAIGTGAGIGLWIGDCASAGRALVLFGCGSMLAAALVLVVADRRMLRAALVQGVLPLIAISAVLASL